MIESSSGEQPVIVTTVDIIPNRACGTLNIHDWVAVARGGEVQDWWQVAARGTHAMTPLDRKPQRG